VTGSGCEVVDACGPATSSIHTFARSAMNR
jgi:hypothetical protein